MMTTCSLSMTVLAPDCSGHTRFVRRPHVSFDAETLAFVSNTPLSQETMNELLQSAEFLVHVAVPGAAAKPAIETIGGDAPSWDVEGGGA